MTNTENLLNEYAAKIDSLAVFATAAAGHNSRFGYQPVLHHSEYATMLGQIAHMAQYGGKMAYLASRVVGRINLYGTQAQAHAAVFTAMADALREEFTDVVGASGPEAGRPSDHRSAYSLNNKILAFAWARVIIGEKGHGWALTDLAKREGVLLPI